MGLEALVRRPALRIVWALSIITIITAGCGPSGGGGGTPSGAGQKKAITIGMLPKLTGIPYFNACRRGAEKAAEELGVKLVYDGPLVADAVQQSEMVNAWTLRGFDVIAVAPNNPEAMAPVLKKARQSGRHVIAWDTDALPDAREYFCNQVSAESMAQALVDVMAQELRETGDVALISGTETASNQNTWMRLMREYSAKKYPKLRLLDPPEYPGEDDARSYQAAQGLLKRPQPPQGIIGMTSVSAPAAAKAVHDAGMSGKVAVTGITLPSSLRQHVKDGTVKRFVLWNPEDLGYLTVYAARRLAEGGTLGDELEAGRLGKLKVKDGEIILGPPLIFDASNIDRFDF